MQLSLIEKMGIQIRVEEDLNFVGGVYTHASHQQS
jgi:hypothetical protein